MRKLFFLLTSALVLLLTSCSDAPPPTVAKKEPEKPEPVTGQSAIFKMYQVARSWSPDVQVLKMNTIGLSDVPDVPRGKAAAWQATFTSSARSQQRSYTYSIIEGGGNLHKGVFGLLEEAWSGPHGENTPFLMAAVKVDTDAAFQTAMSEGGADYDKKNPGKPVTFLLEKIAKYPDPVWRVVWGESVGTSNFSVYVDASTGQFQEKLH
jgi:hypothetical protein